MACQRAHSGRKIFRPVFFAINKKCACRRIVNMRANFITNKENRLKSSRRFSYGGFAQVCKGKTLPGLIGSEAVFEGLRANLQKNRTLVWRCCLRSVFFRLRATLPRRGFYKVRRLPRGRRRRARNPDCRSRLQIRMWHSRRLRGR